MEPRVAATLPLDFGLMGFWTDDGCCCMLCWWSGRFCGIVEADDDAVVVDIDDGAVDWNSMDVLPTLKWLVVKACAFWASVILICFAMLSLLMSDVWPMRCAASDV